MNINVPFFISFLLFATTSCTKKPEHLFTDLSPNKTGVTFKNTLKESPEFNVMKYSYFYNGGGVATGDLDKDGLCDIFFTGNLVASHLYINQGDLKFKNIAKEAGIEAAGLWNTGVTMADVNQDGWLDIYICRSAAQDPDGRRNLLFINQGKNAQDQISFTEESVAYGLDDPAYSTQAAFFDFDRDGDLDMFLLNHSVPEYSNFDNRIGQLKSRPNSNYSDKLYRNDQGKFTDISQEAGLINNVLGFGLGVAVADLNGDQWPDIYVSNDFNEEDYLYINQQNGTFKEQLSLNIDHTSLFSMGSDAADINNDGLNDIVTLDMLPQDNYRIKLTSGADNFNKYQLLLQQGFYKQSMRNMVQLNQGTSGFAEVGQMAGVSNSDWSWSALVADYDLDGWQDLFVTNGYLRDYTNMDFLAFAVDLKVREEATSDFDDHIEELLQHMPEINEPNKIYKNQHGFIFSDSSETWGFNKKVVSNGASYADLDNDGDLDLVINNVNEFASIYKNNAIERKLGNFIKIKLDPGKDQAQALGSHVKLVTPAGEMHRDLFLSRGFQSSVEPMIYFGLGQSEKIDSLIITWPDGNSELFDFVPVNSLYIAKKGTGSMRKLVSTRQATLFTEESILDLKHEENNFNDFRIQPLLPNYYSRSGPPLTAGDINGDGFIDLIAGGAQGQSTQVFLSDGSNFLPTRQADLDADQHFEDVAIALKDINADQQLDLIVASGGNAYPEGDSSYLLRCYFNNGTGQFKKVADFPRIISNANTLAVEDLNGDNFPDIFVGSAYQAHKYPLPGSNHLLINDGKGGFMEDKNQPCKDQHVNAALIIDYDQDGKNELITVGEWEPLRIYALIENNWTLKQEGSEKGWFNTIAAANLDADPTLEFVVGSLGRNSLWIANEQQPIIVYHGDFDHNNTIDPILSCYLGANSYPLPSRDDLIGQIPSLKKLFTSYHDYAEMDMKTLLTHLPDAKADTITEISSILYDLTPEGLHKLVLPIEAQISSVYSILTFDVDQDQDLDLILTGNNHYNRVRIGELDANHGIVLENIGSLNFKSVPNIDTGIDLKGDVRSSASVAMKNANYLIFGINNQKAISYQMVEKINQ